MVLFVDVDSGVVKVLQAWAHFKDLRRPDGRVLSARMVAELVLRDFSVFVSDEMLSDVGVGGVGSQFE